MSEPCIICYKLSNTKLHWDGREELKGFFPLLERHLEPDKYSGGEPNTPLDNLINAGIISCEDCSKVLNSFCELYRRMEYIQLELNSRLKILKGIMTDAEKAPARKRGFRKCAQQLKLENDASVEESIDWIFSFKQDLVQKCTWKLETFHNIKCADKTCINDSPPLTTFDAGNEISTLTPTIVKSEPIETEQMEELDHFNLDFEPLQNIDTVDEMYSESESVEMETADSYVPSFSEEDSDEEAPAPIIITSGSGEDVGEVLQSSLNPETGRYKCSFCSKEFKHNKHAKRHYRNLHLSLRFMCPLCDKEYTRQVDYNRHHQTAHMSKHKCEKCDQMFSNDRKLASHQRLSSCGLKSSINPETGKHKCSLCPSEFEDPEASLNHYEKVHQKPRLTCLDCQKTFSSKKDLERHQQSIHLGVKFQCPVCSKKFSRKDKLVRHQKDICGLLPEIKEPKPKRTKPILQRPVCNQCGETFTCAGHLKRHLKAVHLQIRDHICDTCGKAFNMPRDLKRHINLIHLQIRDHICDTCGKGFGRNSQLQQHVKSVHLPSESNTVKVLARDHVCDTCGRGFSMPRDLRTHINSVHLQLKEFTCDTCGKGFSRSTHLKMHVKAIHTKLREHVCQECGRGFIEPRELERHINAIHLKIRDHNCEFCGKSFALAKGLRRHINTVHLKLQKHECESCGMKFNLKCQLNDHRSQLHPDRPGQQRQEIERGNSVLKFEEADSQNEIDVNNDPVTYQNSS